jgi:hypothetical protein
VPPPQETTGHALSYLACQGLEACGSLGLNGSTVASAILQPDEREFLRSLVPPSSASFTAGWAQLQAGGIDIIMT